MVQSCSCLQHVRTPSRRQAVKKTVIVAAALLVAVAAVGSVQIAAARTGAATMSRAVLEVHGGKLGRFVVDANRRTLYLFEKDKHGRSSCYGACAKVWTPYLTKGRPSARDGVS